MVESLKNLLHVLFNVRGLVEWGGTALVCGIVFIETGFFVGFFLPGDSLLVTAGVFAAAGHLHLAELLLLVPLCAIVGDQVGYWIGRKAGQALYGRKDSLIFRKKHLESAHQFYEKHGAKTIIIARFIPIIRTFCPPVAGAAMMPYGRYFTFDVIGGILWVGGMILGGYTLGSLIPNIDQRIHYVIAGVILLSLLPPIISYLRARNAGNAKAAVRVPSATSEQE